MKPLCYFVTVVSSGLFRCFSFGVYFAGGACWGRFVLYRFDVEFSSGSAIVFCCGCFFFFFWDYGR